MARRRHRCKGSRSAQPNTVHPDAAGLDLGSTEVYAAVRPERDPEPRSGTFPRSPPTCMPWPTGSSNAK